MLGKIYFLVIVAPILANYPPPPLPEINCPSVFKYAQDPSSMLPIGEVSVRKPAGDYYELEVNMSINAAVPRDKNIKILLASDQNELINGQYIKYIIQFPLPQPVPKITQIKLNHQVVCYQKADPISSGTQTAMWAKVGLKVSSGDSGSSGGFPPPSGGFNQPGFPPEPPVNVYPPPIGGGIGGFPPIGGGGEPFPPVGGPDYYPPVGGGHGFPGGNINVYPPIGGGERYPPNVHILPPGGGQVDFYPPVGVGPFQVGGGSGIVGGDLFAHPSEELLPAHGDNGGAILSFSNKNSELRQLGGEHNNR